MKSFNQFLMENIKHQFMDDILQNPLNELSYMAWKDYLEDHGDTSSNEYKVLTAIVNIFNKQPSKIIHLMHQLDRDVLLPNLWRWQQNVFAAYRSRDEELARNNTGVPLESIQCRNLVVVHGTNYLRNYQVIKHGSQVPDELRQLIVLMCVGSYINANKGDGHGMVLPGRVGKEEVVYNTWYHTLSSLRGSGTWLNDPSYSNFGMQQLHIASHLLDMNNISDYHKEELAQVLRDLQERVPNNEEAIKEIQSLLKKLEK